MTLIFDTLTTARMLESKGFTAQQAEGIAEQMNQLLIHDIATKGDIDVLRNELKGELGSLRNELKGDIGSLRTELKGDIDAVRGEMASIRTEFKGDVGSLRTELKGEMRAMASELTVKMYTVGFAVVALVVAAQKLLP